MNGSDGFSLFHSGDIDMWRAILGAVIGCALGLVVGSLVAANNLSSLGHAGAFHLLTVIACMTPFAIVGAVVGGTGAILARIERANPEPPDTASQLLREKQDLPNKIQLPTEEEAE